MGPGFPHVDPLPGDDIDMPYFIVVDDAFASLTIDSPEPGRLWRMHLVYWSIVSDAY